MNHIKSHQLWDWSHLPWKWVITEEVFCDGVFLSPKQTNYSSLVLSSIKAKNAKEAESKKICFFQMNCIWRHKNVILKSLLTIEFLSIFCHQETLAFPTSPFIALLTLWTKTNLEGGSIGNPWKLKHAQKFNNPKQSMFHSWNLGCLPPPVLSHLQTVVVYHSLGYKSSIWKSHFIIPIPT